MSEQERTDGQEEQTEPEMQDLDVSEDQQDDVMGGAMRRGRQDRRK
jgi:hypothetical protein